MKIKTIKLILGKIFSYYFKFYANKTFKIDLIKVYSEVNKEIIINIFFFNYFNILLHYTQ